MGWKKLTKSFLHFSFLPLQECKVQNLYVHCFLFQVAYSMSKTYESFCERSKPITWAGHSSYILCAMLCTFCNWCLHETSSQTCQLPLAQFCQKMHCHLWNRVRTLADSKESLFKQSIHVSENIPFRIPKCICKYFRRSETIVFM